MQMKEDIVSVNKQKTNKPIRKIAKTLEVNKSTIWHILKNKERDGSSRPPKHQEDH